MITGTSEDYEYVSSLYRYDPDTGFIYNQRGERRGGKSGGYIMIWLDGRNYYAHRIAWLLTHKRWPSCHIDHVNGDRSDNRLQNLRDATRQQNMQNRRRFNNNKLGVKGVIKTHGRYRAQLWRDGRFVLSKTFATIEEAAAAYRHASLEYFGVFARLETPLG